jgi:acyl carrier protein
MTPQGQSTNNAVRQHPEATPGDTKGDGSGPAGGIPDELTSLDELQRAITRIWEDVLRLDGLAADADFFELGGHSLTASQVISRMRRSLEVEVPLGTFFDHPTIGELTAFTARRLAGADAAPDRTESNVR